MKIIIFFIMMLVVTGCSDRPFTEENPPDAFVIVGDERYQLIQGSFNWNGMITDTLGPIDLLEANNIEPIPVQSGDELRFEIDYHIQPNETSLYLEETTGSSPFPVDENNHLIVPEATEVSGDVVYYSFDVRWVDDEGMTLAQVSYAFSLKIEN